MDVEPDKLFEQFSVSEVEAVLQSINSEIERKKVELRTLVGERYRDLIETADTISEMKSLSEHFINEVAIMNVDMGNMNFQQSSTLKTDLLKKKKRSVSSSIQDSIAAQINLLVDLPELIWDSVSSRDYIKAAQLFLLGRHVKTGFSVDKNLTKFVERLIVIDQLWNALAHFPKTILNAAENDLRSLEITSEEACTCLCAVALLENKELANRLLSLRLEAIDKCLEGDSNVKPRIIESYLAIVKSLSILWDCFSTENFSKQLLWKRLPLITDASSPPVIKLLEKSISHKYLPPIILQFRASSLYSIKSFNLNDLSSKISDWLLKVKELVTRKGKALLNHIVSLPSLESLTNYQIANREWDQLLVSFKIPHKFELWNSVYKPLITSRAKELISTHCDEAFKEIIVSLESSFKEDNPFKPDTDLRWFVWRESPNDLEIDTITNTRGLLLKSKGITPKIANICKKFEKSLVALYEDLSGLYCCDVTLQADNNELKVHQQNVYVKLLLRLKEHIRELVLKGSVNEPQLSVIARFLLAVPDLCPTLQKCLTHSVDNKTAPWEDAKVLLETEGLFVWSCWESKAVLRLEALIPVHLRKPTSYADLLNIIPQWDIVWIEEGGEGDDKHKSQLRIPSAPSFPLQAILHGLSTELAKSHLPRLVSENLIQQLIPKIVDCYDTSPLCQAESLQNLFDVKYLLAQFIPVTNKELSTLCHEKISAIEANIDPFDLDVFSPYIAANVKSSVLRTQLLFGTYCVMRPDDGSSISQNKMSEDPCILGCGKANSWFPLIPVTNPVSKPLHLVKKKIIKTTKPVPEQSSSEITRVLSSSFLSDWFG